MTEQEIEDRLRSILVEEFEMEPSEVRREARLYDDLGIDSIDAVDLIVQLKDMTGLRIPPEEFKSVRTVDDIIVVMKRLTNAS